MSEDKTNKYFEDLAEKSLRSCVEVLLTPGHSEHDYILCENLIIYAVAYYKRKREGMKIKKENNV